MPYLLGLIIAGLVFLFSLVAWNYSAAELEVARARADAIRIGAQAEARATTIYALLPWGVLVALGLPATILALKYQPRQPEPPQITIEKNYLIEPGQSRRALWQTMSSGALPARTTDYERVERH